MEGPTPVSALIHAATMVTAGVYLVARCTPLFEHAPEAQLVVGCIGAFTALLAALIGLTQNDLKRVLAYSTLSQLGYMFLALGCAFGASRSGAPELLTVAVVAAMFHLFTHAFFKALLFLSAGSVMHAMGGVIDMRRFSGLWRVLPRTHWTFLVGALALAGVPPLSGFWSKDEILDAAWKASQYGPYPVLYMVLLAIGVLTAGLTGFYTFRAYFRTFWGPLRVPAEAGQHGHGDDEAADAHGHATPTVPHGRKAAAAQHRPEEPGHAHESPPVMTVPLAILAVFAAGVGLVLGPLAPEALSFAHFLEQAPGLRPVEHGMNYGLMLISTVVGLLGIGVAYVMYVKQPGLNLLLAHRFRRLYELSLNKFYLDELYVILLVNPLMGLYHTARAIDQFLVDGLVDLIGNLPRLVGSLFRPVQNGLVQFYALAMVLGLTVFLLALVRSL
jgi:NADH-quinone oxidoreductase subunit L